MNTKYRQKILTLTKNYRDKLNKKDFSHDSDHFFRVERLAKLIAEQEGADMEIIEASSLILDIARDMEDMGKVEDHAEEGVNIARKVLKEINFPADKIEKVCHAIFVHRRSKGRVAETIEAKILSDADLLDAMGAIDVARSISSSLQTKKYKRPIYIDKPFETGDGGISAIHFMIYQLKHEKHQPSNFFTKMGKELAKGRYKFMKEYVERFIDEWHGTK
ncbi:MAG: HD domain-containing protein [Candidatus Shapirobacteria bacterium]|jgi:uncharacterized protein